MNHHLIRKAVRGALFAGAAASLSQAPAVLAQDQDEAAQLGKQTVTGSRIRRIQIEGANPVTVLTRDDIERAGYDSVGKILQELPQVTGSPINTGTNNGGNGAVRMDLRGLTPVRTLVLLNGRRFVNGGGTTSVSSSVDLNMIPLSIVERVEVLADGASTVYGADAVAGVVNIITRQDYDGAEVGGFFTQSSESDGDISQVNFVVGLTTSRGNITVGGDYTDQEEVFMGQRQWSEFPEFVLTLASGPIITIGSSRVPQGSYAIPAGNTVGLAPGFYTTDAGGAGARPFVGGGTPNDTYNYAPINYLQTPSERANIWLQGRYDLTDNLNLFVEGLVHNRKSDQALAPLPFDARTDPGSPLSGQGNPSVVVGTTTGVTFDNFYNPFGADISDVRRRQVEAGPRSFSQNADTWRFVGGLQGSVGAFDWEASFNWGQNDMINVDGGQFSGERLAAAMGPSAPLATDPTVLACGSSADVADNGLIDNPIVTGGAQCTPLDLFGGAATQPITSAQLDYVTVTLTDVQQNTQQIWSAFMTGDVAQLPAGPFGLAFGYEHRKEEGFFFNDSAKVLGAATGNITRNTQGSYKLDEFYVEAAIPLVSGVVAAQLFEITLGGRYSDFSNFGDTTTFTGGLRWQPIDTLLLRGTYSEVFRAPTISELFLGPSDSFPVTSDPCGNNPTPAQQVNCAADGVPGGSYTQTDTQIRQIVGGNPNLQPESGDMLTVGFAWSPNWAQGLTVTGDWWRLDLNDRIAFIGNATTLAQCADTGAARWCDNITRFPNGEVQLTNALQQNLGFEKAQGVDFNIEHNFSLGVGDFQWDLLGTYSIERNTQVFQGGPVNTSAGTWDNRLSQAAAYPRWRLGFNFTYSTGPWSASYGADYIHAMDELLDPLGVWGVNGAVEPGQFWRIPSVVYMDVQGTYNFGQGTRVSLFVTNITDEDPSRVNGGIGANTDSNTYRLLGTTWMLRATHNFQ